MGSGVRNHKICFFNSSNLRIRSNSIRKKVLFVNDGRLGSDGGGRGIHPVVRVFHDCRISAHTLNDSSHGGLVSRT